MVKKILQIHTFLILLFVNMWVGNAQDLSKVSVIDEKDSLFMKYDAPLVEIIRTQKKIILGKSSNDSLKNSLRRISSLYGVSTESNKIQVLIRYRADQDIDEKLLFALGIERDDHYYVFQNYVQALIPITSLETIERIPGVAQITLPPIGLPDVISEGVTRVNARRYTDFGYRGQGIKVAILDIGFLNYDNLLGSELPSSVIVRSYFNSTSGNGDITASGRVEKVRVHGTACAEIAYDMAPQAQLYLVNYNTISEMDAAVNYLIEQGVKIISHSAGMFNQSFYDGSGPVCNIVDNARDNGILWINSAGNYAQMHWEGYFSDSDNDKWNEFSSGGDETININAVSGQTISIFLTWDDWNLSCNDYDLFLLNNSSQEVASSKRYQACLLNPTEEISYLVTQSGTYHVAIRRPFSAGILQFQLFTSTHNFGEYQKPATSLVDPAPSTSSLTVGAMNYAGSTIESFSSQGPTTNGTTKPNITGPDYVSTYTYGSNDFPGTSASAPHVAGAAALIWSENTSRTSSQVQSILQSNAIDYGPSGVDNIYGYGMLNLPISSGGGCNQPSNDGCSGSFAATPLSFGSSCNPISSTSCGATSSGFSSCVGTQDDDVFFSFVPTSSSATITVVSSVGYDAAFQVLTGPCGSSMFQLECINNTGTGGTETTTVNGLTTGVKYFIRVWHYGSGYGTTGNFNICVTTPSGSSGDDFYITNTSVSPTTIEPGGSIQVSSDLCYSGDQLDENVGRCYLGYYLSTNKSFELSNDIYLEDDSSIIGKDDPCNSNSHTITIPTGTSPGTYYFLFVADHDGRFSESNESNNVEFVQIEISGSSGDDFYITNTSVSPTTIEPGGSIQVSSDLCYSGDRLDENVGRCYLGYYLSTNKSFELSNDIYLEDDSSIIGKDDPCNSNSHTITIPSDTSPGTYYFLFVADHDGRFSESNEANNLATVQLTIISSIQAPIIASQTTSYITSTSVHINAEVNPKGNQTNVYFQYGTTSNYGNNSRTLSAGSGTANVSINTDLSNLIPNTLYHFRTVATNSGGTTNGNDITFNTLPNAQQTPTIIVNPSQLVFSDQQINTNSAAQSYTLTGNNLTSDVTIYAPNGFSVSPTQNGMYQNTIAFLKGTGSISTSVWIRFSPTQVQSYLDNVINSSPGATNQNVAVSGTGTVQTNTYSISGSVYRSDGSGLTGVVMNGFPTYTSTDRNGYYSCTVNSGWSGTVIPTRNGYTFYPASQSYSNVNNDMTQNYTVIVQTNFFTISGSVYASDGSGISDVVMSGFPTYTSTDGSGYYSCTVNSGWSGTVTPTKNGYTFSPLNQSYSNVTSNETKNYFGTIQTTTQTIFYGNSARTWSVTTPETGYVFGTNSYGDIGKYQRFDIIGSGKLSQVKIYFAAKQIIGGVDNFNLVVRSYGTGGAPGTILYSQSYSTNIIDVTNPGSSYSSFTINPQITVNEKFFIGIEWAGSISDQFAIIADADGEGESQNRAWERWSDGTFHDVFTSWTNFDVDIWIASIMTVITDIKKDENVIPSNYALYQNYPNPFNPTTNIEYSIPYSGFVSIKVYDVLGKEIAILVNEEKQPGNYKVTFDGSKLTSGVYFYQLRAGIFSQIQKLLMIK